MKVAIVGASGAVGQEFLRVLEERNFPLDELVLFGSTRSAGSKYKFRGKEIEVKLLQHNDDFKDIDIAFTSAGAGTSKEFAEDITRYGAVMIDNSSAFRMDKDVPRRTRMQRSRCLGASARHHRQPELYDHHDGDGFATYRKPEPYQTYPRGQLSGCQRSGAAAMAELEQQYREVLEGKPVTVKKFAYQLAYNVIPKSTYSRITDIPKKK